MMTPEKKRGIGKIASGIGVAALVLLVIFGPQATANHLPANKVAVSGGSLSTLSASSGDSEAMTILAGTFKSSNPTDLAIQVTAECSLWTDIRNEKNSDSTAFASVKVWVEIDGRVVPTAYDDAADPGKVTFCERYFQMRLSGVVYDNTTIETYLRTKSSHAFNWITMNVGSGEHWIVVKAQVDRYTAGEGNALGWIGKRSLIVEPTKLSGDVTV